MAEQKQFQAESERLLDLMVNSIYTHKEIFLRELISNASDALDKYHLYALEHQIAPSDLDITIEPDLDKRTLTIRDNGIGMSEQELEENLGTIAKSGSLAFKEQLKKQKEDNKDQENQNEVDIIGQFGVGFYSAFMVAKEVTVLTRRVDEEQAYQWHSDGKAGYTIEPTDYEGHGTTIILTLKDDDENEKYSEYLNTWQIQDLIKKYSDYIRYPIQMEVERQQPIEQVGEQKDEPVQYETIKELKTLNSMVPLWKRPKSEITQEEFDQYYQSHFNDFTKPLSTIFFNVEGNVSFNALLYIPSKRPENFYSRYYKPGLQLFSRSVMIENNCESLLPDYLRFVKGLVDSQDLSLNISREMLQHDRQLKLIRSRIEKKVLAELKSMKEKDPESYAKFWNAFGLDLKFEVYNSYGASKDKLQDLLMFHYSESDDLISLKDFVALLPEDRKEIFYASGNDETDISKLPIVTKLKSKNIPVLLLTDEIDEFVLRTIDQYDEHHFVNAAQGDLNLDSEEEKQLLKEQNDENKDLLEFMKESLPQVSEVRLSSRLVDDPVMLVAGEEGMSFEMEKLFNRMAQQDNQEQPIPGMQAKRILEINPNAKVWAVLRTNFTSDKDKVKAISQVLYDQACLIAGFNLEDPIGFSRRVADLLG